MHRRQGPRDLDTGNYLVGLMGHQWQWFAKGRAPQNASPSASRGAA